MVVLAMLFSVPFFDVTTWITPPSSYEIGLEMMSQFDVNTECFNIMFENYVMDEAQTNTPIILINANNVTWDSKTNVNFIYN